MKIARLAILFLCIFILVKIYTYIEILNFCCTYADYNKNGLTGYYYSHPDLQGEPFLIRTDKKIDFLSSNSELFKNTQFSIKWAGILDIPKTGNYTLGVGADDSAWLYIDGKLIVANTGLHPFKRVSKKIALNRGYHLLELKYIQAEGKAGIQLYWKPPTAKADKKAIIPSTVLIPFKRSINPNSLFHYHIWIFGQNVLLIIFGFLLVLYSKSYSLHIRLPLFLICIIIGGGIIRLLYLGSVPGLHADEAWAGFRALEIIDGMRPLSGLAFYTGPILHYILAFLFSIFGISIFTLRSAVALINIINIFLIYKLTKQIYDKQTGIIAALLFACSPWHIIYSRMVLEHTFLTIFFILISLYFLTKPNRKIWHICITGLLMGLGTYNYLLFLTLPLSIVIVYIFYTKGMALIRKELWLGVLSFGIGYFPKLYDNYRLGINLLSFTKHAGSSILDFINNMWLNTSVFLQCLDGTILYQRFCGNINILPIPVNSTLFLWSICILTISIIGRKKTWFKENSLLLTVFILNYSLVIFITKEPYLRFFLIPLTLAVIISAKGINSLLNNKKWIYTFTIFIVFINIFYLCTNYINQFLKSGGKSSVFTYGKAMDTSNHFMDTKKLYKFILEKGPIDVYVNDFLYKQLEFHDAINHNIRIWSIEEPRPRKNSWLIFYNGPSIYPLEDITTYKFYKGKFLDLPYYLKYNFRIYET